MAWTTPTTRATNLLVTASIWNTDLVDNLNWLKNRTYDVITISTTTTTSATFGAMTGASITLTNTSGGRVLLWFTGTIQHSGVQNVTLDFAIDGTKQGNATNGLQVMTIAGANYSMPVCMVFLTDTAPSAGSHTYTIHWKTTAATATLLNGNQFGAMDFA